MEETIQRINVIAGTANRILGRAKISSGDWATSSNVTQIDAKVQQQGNDTPTFDGELSPVGTYISDSLDTSEANYAEDSNDARTTRGVNFAWTIPASAFPSRGWYTAEVLFTDASGVTKLLWEGPATGTLDAGS